jgi:DNA repair exonuclease SbcCD ATPase subunit
MSYKDEQTLLFDGASLWVLAGPNGAGKSAIFDALTFALYGRHRGGSQNAQDLINHHSDALVVEFDFLIDKSAYRLRRTVSRKGRSTREAFRLMATDEGQPPSIEPIAGTDTKDGFDKWVAHTIGLNYNTFTSSVLLMQGQSEKLLQADPKERYEILAELIDLSSYQQLYQIADEHRKEYAAQVKSFENQLQSMTAVSDEDISQAQLALDQAEKAHQDAQEQVDSLTELLAQAKQWERLKRELEMQQAELQKERQLLEHSEEIESAFDRFQQLDQALSSLKAIVEQRHRLLEASGQIEKIQHEIQKLQSEFDKASSQKEVTKLKVEQLSSEIDKLQGTHTSLANRLVELAPLVEKLKQLEEAQAELSQIEQKLNVLPTDLERLVKQTEEKEAQLSASERTLASAITRAETKYNEVCQRGERFEKAVDQATCELCGQPITLEHAQQEQKRLKALLSETEAELAQLKPQHRKTEEQLKNLKSHLRKLREQLAQWQRWDAQRQAVSKRLIALTESASAPELHQALKEQEVLKEEQSKLQAQLEKRKPEQKKAKEKFNQANQKLEELGEALQRYATELNKKQAAQIETKRYLESLIDNLPEIWQKQVDAIGSEKLKALSSEHEKLSRYKALASDLAQARQAAAMVERRIEELNSQVKALPQEAKCPAAEVAEALNGVKNQLNQLDKERRQAQLHLTDLKKQRQQRSQLEEKKRHAERQHHLYAILSELLGRRGLQLHLLRRAERAIVDLANETLDGLSRGRMRLELRGTDDEAESQSTKALDLMVYNYDTGAHPTAVALASGSQRFRIAVSLALAIGRYLSRESRKIESVIIDEGFGSLDKNGRDDMIQELNSLKEQLSRIILVSHQEEFTSAFVNGYLVELVDGTSQVRFLEQG